MSDRFTDPSFLGSSDRHLGGRNALVNQFEKDLEQFEKWEDYYNQERYTQRDMVFVDGSYKLGYHEVVNEKPVFEVVDPAPEDRGMLLITCIEGYVKGLKQDGILPTLKLFNEKITECKSYKDHSFVALFHELEAHNPHKLVLFSILEGIFELKDELSYNSQAKRQTMHELALEIDAHHFTQTQLMKKDLIDLPNRVIKAHKGIRGIFAGLDIRDRKSTRLNSSHPRLSRMPSSA